MEQKMEQKQQKQDELIEIVFEQETATSQDSPRETKPRIIRVNPDTEKDTIHVTDN